MLYPFVLPTDTPQRDECHIFLQLREILATEVKEDTILKGFFVVSVMVSSGEANWQQVGRRLQFGVLIHSGW